MPRDVTNLDASPDGDDGSDELTCEFLPGLEPYQVIQEAREENNRGGGEKVADYTEVSANQLPAELKG